MKYKTITYKIRSNERNAKNLLIKIMKRVQTFQTSHMVYNFPEWIDQTNNGTIYYQNARIIRYN